MPVKSLWNRILMTATSRNRPTPSPTAAMRTVPFMTAPTWPARTERSGSATVMRRPITKQTLSRMPSFLDLVRPSPMCCPIGVIAMSAPRLKRLMPATRRRAAPAKTTSSWREMSTHGVTESRKTRRLTGTTEIRDSLSFSRKDFQRSRKMDEVLSMPQI